MAGDGSASGFNASDFRSAIRFAMTMGAPVNPAEQVTFIIAGQATYAGADPAGDPYDWTTAPTTTVVAQAIHVLAAVTFGSEPPVEGTAVGVFDASRISLTVLDEDYAPVRNADEVIVGGVHYIIDPPGAVPVGLFDVTVYTIHATARG
jgi:hypothetical protein